MTTPVQVPDAPAAPAQPRSTHVWLMRGSCYAVVALLAWFAWRVPDSIFVDVIAGALYLVLALRKPTERLLRAAMYIAVLGFTIGVCVLVIPYATDNPLQRGEVVLFAVLTAATITMFAGALLALRSVPKEAWIAQRPPQPSLEAAQVDKRFAALARALAVVALAAPFFAVAYSNEGAFVFFGILFAMPYLVFILNPIGVKWVGWGRALPIVVGIITALVLIPSVAAALGEKHVLKGERIWLALLVALFVIQPLLFLATRRAYKGRVPFGGQIGQGVIYYVCAALFAAATLPSMVISRRSANESSGAASLRTINTAAINYQTQYPNVGYPPSLKVLGACSEPATKDATCLLDTTLGCPAPACIKYGYRFTYKPVLKDGVVVHYSAVARPVEYEETGTRSFYSDETAVIRSTDEDRDANANDPPL